MTFYCHQDHNRSVLPMIPHYQTLGQYPKHTDRAFYGTDSSLTVEKYDSFILQNSNRGTTNTEVRGTRSLGIPSWIPDAKFLILVFKLGLYALRGSWGDKSEVGVSGHNIQPLDVCIYFTPGLGKWHHDTPILTWVLAIWKLTPVYKLMDSLHFLVAEATVFHSI